MRLNATSFRRKKISLNHLFYQDKTKYSLKVLQNDVAIKVRRPN